MRSDMIKPKEGETDFTVLKHYDNMRRVSARKQRYSQIIYYLKFITYFILF